MKKLILASAISAAFVGSFAQAEEAAKSDHEVSYNMGVTSDYVFRGISQSRNKPAFSAGVDYSHTPSGFYAGTWASTISWINDATDRTLYPTANTPYELDLYAGMKGEIGGGFSYDAGAIHYFYPGHKLGKAPDANTTEVYGKIAYGPVSLKVNYALGDAFWTSNKAGSYYVDASGDFPVMEGLTLNLHAGRFEFKDAPGWSYSDWKVGLTKDFGNGLSGALAATGTNAQNVGFWNFNSTGYLGDTKGIVSLTKTF
jgi:uncharacterized protein (TIGR02001 family)